MAHDFDKCINRIGTECVKWDSREEYSSGEVIPMWIGDMDFECPSAIVDALKKRCEHPVYGYAYRCEKFQNVTVDWIKRRHNWNIKSEWVTFSPGVVPAISAFVQTMTAPGDKILIQRPVYYPFTNTIESCGREVVSNSLVLKNGHYEIDFKDLEEKAKREDINTMILCNPHNPVGRVYTVEELNRIADICIKNNIIVFCDEIHSDFIFGGNKHISLASLSDEMSKRTITSMAPSKTFNIAGLQAASIITSNKDFLEKLESHFKMNTQHCINDFGLVAYEAAYTKCDEYVDELVNYVEGNLRFLKEYINDDIKKVKVTNQEGTYFAWLDLRDLNMTNEELDKFFMEKVKVGLDSGYIFGPEGNGFMRINMACPRRILTEGLQRIKSAVNNLK